MRLPRNDTRYAWTHHAVAKMLQYGIGEGRVKRIIRVPKRTEEGIAENTVAVMSPYGRSPGGRQPYRGEVWVMYRLTKPEKKGAKPQFLIITAWRYPGVSPARNPVPKEIMDEVRALL